MNLKIIEVNKEIFLNSSNDWAYQFLSFLDICRSVFANLENLRSNLWSSIAYIKWPLTRLTCLALIVTGNNLPVWMAWRRHCQPPPHFCLAFYIPAFRPTIYTLQVYVTKQCSMYSNATHRCRRDSDTGHHIAVLSLCNYHPHTGTACLNSEMLQNIQHQMLSTTTSGNSEEWTHLHISVGGVA